MSPRSRPFALFLSRAVALATASKDGPRRLKSARYGVTGTTLSVKRMSVDAAGVEAVVLFEIA